MRNQRRDLNNHRLDDGLRVAILIKVSLLIRSLFLSLSLSLSLSYSFFDFLLLSWCMLILIKTFLLFLVTSCPKKKKLFFQFSEERESFPIFQKYSKLFAQNI